MLGWLTGVDVCSKTLFCFFSFSNAVYRAATTPELHLRQCNWAFALWFSFSTNGLSSARGAIHHMHYLKSGASIKIGTVKRRWMALVAAKHHPPNA